MRGKLTEGITAVVALKAQVLNVGNTVYYNGNSVTTGAGIGIDTQGYDNVDFIANVGTMVGAQGVSTVQLSIYESATDSPAASTLVTGANFDDITLATDDAQQEGSITCAGTKRYLFLRANIQGTPSPTLNIGVVAILGKADSQATTKTLKFDL